MYIIIISKEKQNRRDNFQYNDKINIYHKLLPYPLEKRALKKEQFKFMKIKC